MTIKPRYPIFIPSRGRYESNHTARALIKFDVPFRLVVQPDEAELYRAALPNVDILVLPDNNIGLLRTRLWIRAVSEEEGFDRHWQLDDNMHSFNRLHQGQRIAVDAGVALRVCEDLTDRYSNIGVSGLNYTMFVVNHEQNRVTWNHKVYSCSLVNNMIPQRWRLAYNDDTDLCLQVLAAGMCTLQLNAFNVQKIRTMMVKGGNTDDLYQANGRLVMAKQLQRAWPRVVTTKRKFGRPQHEVRWGLFKQNHPVLKDQSEWPASMGDYGLKLTQVADEVQSKVLRDLLDSERP